MSLELRDRTIQNWIVSPADQTTEEFASLSHETNRIPDPYIFKIVGKKLVSPSNGKFVEESVTTKTVTERLEFEALQKIQKWAGENDRGMALWFSPPGPYSCLKIVSSEIAFSLTGEKVLFNRAVVLDVDQKTSLQIAGMYPGNKSEDANSLRNSPKFLTLKEAENWTEPLIPYTDQVALIASGEDLLAKIDTLEKAKGITSRYQAKSAGLVGSHSDSCSPFAMFLSNAEKSFPCPRCHKAIPSGMGITKCPFCGVTKKDVGSTCD